MANQQHQFIQLIPTKDSSGKGALHIKYAYHKFYRKEESGMLSFYIPAYDIYFSADNIEEGDRLGTILTRSFFRYWIKRIGFNEFVLEIRRLGFVTEGGVVTIQKLLQRRISSKTKFKFDNGLVPEGFSKAESIEKEFEMAY